ncbi:MAG: BlaI/MecI/CopY family transcriptional regulator [Oscillospiraceae bacterium]
MDNQTISLTTAEWSVMECLWEHSPLTGREAAEQLKQKMGWTRSTTLTLLRRLEDKGAIAGDSEGSLKTFRPLLQRDDAALRETEDLLERVYHGSLSLMVSAMTRKQALSQREIDELYAILREMEADRDG